MGPSEVSGPGRPTPAQDPTLRKLPLTTNDATDYFDSHLTSKIQKPGSGIRPATRGAAFGTRRQRTGDRP